MTKIFILIACFALITLHAARDGLVYEGGPMLSQAPMVSQGKAPIVSQGQAPTVSQGQAPMVSLASIISQAPIVSPT